MTTSARRPIYNDIMGTPPQQARRIAREMLRGSDATGASVRRLSAVALLGMGAAVGAALLVRQSDSGRRRHGGWRREAWW